jgi:CHAD domain-containing protein
MSGPPDLPELRLRARELARGASLAESARVQLCLQARELESALPEALPRLRPGPVHDARVASRRLRAGMTLFQRLYPRRWHTAVGMARSVTQGLREARDLDIRRARLLRLSRKLGRGDRPCREVLEELATRAGEARAAGGAPALPAARLFGELAGALWRPRLSGAADADRFARVWLHELQVLVANTVPMASVEAHGGVQHRLRIRGKALRYSLEMMQWELGAEAAWRISALREVQDTLGELHDVDMLLDHLREESARRRRAERRCLDEASGVLHAERRRLFKLFLGRRAELESACGPIRFP